ncbi:MAG TPA: hypothetical protein VN719_02890, partial [Gemmatimonadales bacterium]|nr:hypothetical protein [Gemmatimonadales bacterium]
ELAQHLRYADDKNAWWRDLILGTATLDVGHLRRIGATPLLLVRLMKLLSDADLLLTRTTGLGSLRVVLQFHPGDAQEIAEKSAASLPVGHPAAAALRQSLADAEEGMGLTTITPHYLLALLARHCDGEVFTPEEFGDMLRQLSTAPTDVLLYRLGFADEKPEALRPKPPEPT